MVTNFEIINLKDLLKHPGFGTGPDARLGVRETGLPTELVIPEPGYGDSATEFQSIPGAQDKCSSGLLKISPPEIYTIRDCIVWSKYGLIFVDQYLIRESLFHFPAHLMPEITLTGAAYRETNVSLEADFSTRVSIDNAVTALAGIQENYYHWFMFVLAKFEPAVFGRAEGALDPIILVPGDLKAYQITSMAALRDFYNLRSISFSEKAFVHVKNLTLPWIFRNGGLVPHPIIKRPFNQLVDRLKPNEQMPQKLYISRQDSTNRKLANEEEIEALLKVFGFRIVVLTGMALEDQVSLFRSATHIIAPHGAGLTNVIFCKPGTKLLEIHTDIYVNWCYRRLCALYDLDYGFITGKSETADPARLFAAPFTLDVRKLETILFDSDFLKSAENS